MATHSNYLAWEVWWTEQPGGLQFMVPRVCHIMGSHSKFSQSQQLLQLHLLAASAVKSSPFIPEECAIGSTILQEQTASVPQIVEKPSSCIEFYKSTFKPVFQMKE